MRTADGRIILNDIEYHYVECSGCGENTLTKVHNTYVTCETCAGMEDESQAHGRQVFGDGVGRHWAHRERYIES